MNLMNKKKLLIVGQLLLILWSIACAFLYIINVIDKPLAIEGLKYLIVLEILYIAYSIIVINIGFLHVYSVFIMTVSLYNVSLVFVDLFGGNDMLLTGSLGCVDIKYNKSIVVEYLSIILIFYLFVHLSALCVFLKSSKLKNIYIWDYDKRMEANGMTLFYLFLVPALIYYFSYFKQLILAGGYRNMYELGISTSDLNIFIRLSDDLMKLGFFLILASKSRLNRLIIPCIIYLLLYFIQSILSGSRVHFISQSLFLLVYFSMRIRIKMLNIAVILFFFIFFSIFTGYLRSTTDHDYNAATTKLVDNAISDEIVETFLVGQGSSMHVVGVTVDLSNKGIIDHSMRYLTFPLYNNSGYVKGRSRNDYYNLADRLSAVLIPKDFLYGAGLGSSIIAEFYIYGGVFTVIIFSILYSVLICLFDLSKFKSNQRLLFFMIILPGLFYVGRASPLFPVLSTYKLFVMYYVLIAFGFVDKVRLLIKKFV